MKIQRHRSIDCDRDALLLAMRNLIEQLGHIPSHKELHSAGISPATVHRHLGTREQILEALGMEMQVNTRRYRDRTDIPQCIRELADELGHSPSWRELDESGLSVKRIASVWGSVQAAFAEAGIKPQSRGRQKGVRPVKAAAYSEKRAKFEEPMPWPSNYGNGYRQTWEDTMQRPRSQW